ncbi:MAG: response regulator [Gemmatimonadota bacterium]|nr:response regulator [Gemmatimonadota bacterium]
MQTAEKSFRLLFVDDNMAVRKSLHQYFTIKKWPCDMAATGNEALELAEKNHYHICIMDLGLEGDLDGLSSILRIRKLSPETRFLIYTGKLDFELPESLRRIGMSEENVLRKPLHMSRLEAIITEMCND